MAADHPRTAAARQQSALMHLKASSRYPFWSRSGTWEIRSSSLRSTGASEGANSTGLMRSASRLWSNSLHALRRLSALFRLAARLKIRSRPDRYLVRQSPLTIGCEDNLGCNFSPQSRHIDATCSETT